MISLLHLCMCVCVCVITAICAHIPVLYITSTHSQRMMHQTHRCRVCRHRNRIVAKKKACKHFRCCHGEMDTLCTPCFWSDLCTALRSVCVCLTLDVLPEAVCERARQVLGLDNILTPVTLYGAHSVVRF